ERERQAGAQALSEQQQRVAEAKQSAALQAATRRAEMEVIASRENHLALAGLALLLAMASGAAAIWLGPQVRRRRERKGAIVAAAVLVLLVPVAWFTRPSIAGIDDRAHDILAEASESAAPQASTTPSAPAEAAYTCVFNPQRSRVTVSETADVPLNWSADGCVNGR